MDDILVNKYLGQFNPILVVPVLSAVVGAILVFVFGFKRPNEPRFQSSNTSDTLKKSKKKGNSGARSADNHSQTSRAQNATPQKISRKTATNPNDVAAKKSVNAVNSDKLSNKKREDKKTDEKKTEASTPVKKIAQKKAAKDSPNVNGISATNKKQKQANKKSAFEEKPADFDDGNWFTVQSKSSKKANKIDENGVNVDTSSPKTDSSSKVKLTKAKGGKNDKLDKNVEKNIEKKSDDSVVETVVPATAAKDVVAESAVQPTVENSTNVTAAVEKPVAPVATPADVETVPEISEKREELPTPQVTAKPKPVREDKAAVADAAADENSAIAFDELGEWTDAKPDRKRGNKKKSRKD